MLYICKLNIYIHVYKFFKKLLQLTNYSITKTRKANNFLHTTPLMAQGHIKFLQTAGISDKDLRQIHVLSYRSIQDSMSVRLSVCLSCSYAQLAGHNIGDIFLKFDPPTYCGLRTNAIAKDGRIGSLFRPLATSRLVLKSREDVGYILVSCSPLECFCLFYFEY